MINGVLNGDNQTDPTPIILAFNQWAESETEGMGQILLRANLTEGSTFCNDAECSHTLGIDFVEEGQIINGMGGDAAFLAIYEQMYAAIRDSNFPQITSLPGAQAVRDRLAVKILEYGGTVPLVGDFNNSSSVDGADFLAWQRGIDTLFNTSDLATWEVNFGAAALLSESSTTVPEPSTFLTGYFTAAYVFGLRLRQR